MKQRYVRLTRPLVRAGDRGGPFREATWDEALDRVAGAFEVARVRGAERSFGLFSCSKATNEMNYVSEKFARAVMGSNNVDSCNRT